MFYKDPVLPGLFVSRQIGHIEQNRPRKELEAVESAFRAFGKNVNGYGTHLEHRVAAQPNADMVRLRALESTGTRAATSLERVCYQ